MYIKKQNGGEKKSNNNNNCVPESAGVEKTAVPAMSVDTLRGVRKAGSQNLCCRKNALARQTNNN